MSDPYSVRYSKFWQAGGLSGLDLHEDWGYSPSGKKRTNGLEATEPYFNVLQEERMSSVDDDDEEEAENNGKASPAEEEGVGLRGESGR
mmetsp:Transcript_92681/g.149628  ORF Transcript_92681/g.149628 Transcript_92681/m.149628 type:complete len:89 (+) Transcript_92681:3-269(+)